MKNLYGGETRSGGEFIDLVSSCKCYLKFSSRRSLNSVSMKLHKEKSPSGLGRGSILTDFY